jgi:hypothetical protein
VIVAAFEPTHDSRIHMARQLCVNAHAFKAMTIWFLFSAALYDVLQMNA